MMFSYYGSKTRVVNLYPEPRHNLIIEPFAGSARYSLRFYKYNCWLNDSYKIICDIWNWIIRAKLEDLEKILELKEGDDLRSYNLEPDLKNLLGFVITYGRRNPHNICSKWSARDNQTRAFKKRLLKYIEKLTHWKITNLDYLDLPDVEATWFIDAPYQSGGQHYVYGEINYKQLSEWCLSRKGQIIVCENSKANWLNFIPLKKMQGQKYTTMEVMFTN